jgi:hypothetical protein
LDGTDPVAIADCDYDPVPGQNRVRACDREAALGLYTILGRFSTLGPAMA